MEKKTDKKHIGKDAVLTMLTLYRGQDPLDYFYVTIVGVHNDKEYIVIADRRNRQFIVHISHLWIP